LGACSPTRRVLGGKAVPFAPAGVQDLGDFRVRFSGTDGSITSLVDRSNAKEWADDSHPMALFRYQSLSAADYERFVREFVVNMDDEWIHSWAAPDYGRLGLTPAHSESAFYSPKVVDAWREGDTVLFTLRLPSQPRERCGAPADLQLSYAFGGHCIDVGLSWFDKPASRLPEAAWLSFAPPADASDAWELHKLGRWVSPLDVMSCGNRNMHGIGEGVRLTRGRSRLVIESADAHLVSPGAPRLLQFDDTLPRLDGGMHFCLHANLYSTNFPLWYEDDALFRFRLRFADVEGKG
jgi:hypothetical protein